MIKTPVLLAAIACLPATAQVVINEVSTSNMNGITDSFGEREDWVELYNTTSAAVDLTGWYVSNKVNNPAKWPFPAGASIPANGYLMVYCSKRNTAAGGAYHTSFKLNQSDNDHVVLADPSATIVDDVLLDPRTKLEHSRGRTTDGAATWSLFQTPTPNAPNVGASPFYAPRPQLSPAAGFYGGATNVTMSTTDPNSTIRYTLDGTEPTAASTAYTAPISIATTTVVRAACFSSAPGVPPSFIETNTYFINVSHTTAILSIAGDQVDELLNGNNGIEPYGSFEYFGPDQQLRDEATGQFNKHGNDSWAYDQRGFDYVTRDQAGYNDGIHYPIFHASNRNKFQRLIIKSAANDNYPFETGGAYIRDAYVHSLSQAGGLKLDVRTYEPCVLYMNGQYWGLYEIREKCDDNDYTKEYYDQDQYDLQYLKTWGNTWSEYGGAQAQTDWDALLAYIMSNNMGDPTAFAYVDGQYNWKSLVDYVVLNSYTVCTDWLNWNTAWWRGSNPAGEHKKWGYVLWDNDATFGHYINYTNVPQTTPDADPCNAEALPDPGGQGHVLILQKFMDENPMVHDYYVNRYIDLGNTLFSCGTMLPYLDSLINLITPEMPGQVARWGGTMAEWEGNVQNMRDFIEARCTAIQDGMVDCYNLTGPDTVVFRVEPPLSGTIKINSITPAGYPFAGLYYGGIATTLQAKAEPDWVFDHWETIHSSPNPTLTDSLVTINFSGTDTVIAHFAPPIKYPVVLLTDPPNTASIQYNADLFTTFPATVERIPESIDTLTVIPAMYYTFHYWEFKYNTPNQNDTTLKTIPVTIFYPDTIIAHLEPQDYAYFGPNAFTPNGDGINDTWRPVNNVVDLDNYLLQIFDRWGRELFTSTDPFEDWDGKADGKTVPLGVYVYRASMQDAITLESHKVKGYVTVVP
ncbi:MAG: CotH kinase family protein [Flavobacteriales bacterium]|nr:CotH kinase family protein [Flavobacteriales bacterium]